MSRSLFLPIIKNLSKIYFSKIENKEYEYKKTIFYILKDMGGIYVKFLQVLCLMHKFTEGWGGPKEFEVFNKVTIENIDIKRYIPNQDKFKYIEEIPFACGSFAQVYKAELNTGEIIALKVLRPSIVLNLKSDLKKLKHIVRIFDLFMPTGLIDYKQAFEEFARNSILETDYDREMSNMKYFIDLYKNHEYVKIPKIYRDFSTKRIIAQEYMEGPTLADVIYSIRENETLQEAGYRLTGSDIWKQIMIVGGEALRTALVADYVFGDPHPGNIILLKDDKIAIVDFGIIANKPTSQEAFYLWVKAYYEVLMGTPDYGRLLKTTYMCFCPDLTNALNKCSTENGFMNTLSEAVTDKAKFIISNNFAAESLVENGHLFKAFNSFLDNKNALNMRIDIRNFQLLKAMQAFIGSVTTIDDKYGNNRFSELMKDSMKYALEYSEKQGIKDDLPNKSKYNINESYELLLETLSSLAEGDEFLFENISERMFL